MMPLYEFGGKKPSIHPGALVAKTACLVGEVVVGEGTSIWPGAVLRGDLNAVRVGRFTSIQDNCVLHTDMSVEVCVGDYVTVGHGAVIHGALVEDHVLIGIGSIILNGAKIGRNSIIAAGSVVREGTEVPPGTMFAGVPAKLVKELDQEEQRIRAEAGALGYYELARQHPELFG
ncbi:MAG: gamma carbonic anhydrase family protein [Hadesarchaea archaeon]|nr:MAG: gamma carbonic anhydrase family protein [Hadesarchaea archaeon]